MSAALVRKSLSLVDPQYNNNNKTKKKKHILDFLPDDKKLTKKITNRSNKARKVDLLQRTNKLTVTEAKRKMKSKEDILKQNLKKLELIKELCTVDLDKDVTSQLFRRARTRRPVQIKGKKHKKADEKTVFTEDDFKKFEDEYLAS